MPVRINGKALANKIEEELDHINLHDLKHAPKLATVLVGHDRASEMYIKMKENKADAEEIRTLNIQLGDDTDQLDLDSLIHYLNTDQSVNAILVQLPLPRMLNENKVAREINPEKDADGVSPANIGKLATNVQSAQSIYAQGCTPLGIMMLLKHYHMIKAGMRVTIIGRSNIVGRPLALMMINRGLQTTVLNSQASLNNKAVLDQYTKHSDIIVSATGQLNLITASDIKPGAILVDVGENHDKNGKLCGDISADAKKKSKAYTPVPGGVGPMTIAMLMYQTTLLASIQHGTAENNGIENLMLH